MATSASIIVALGVVASLGATARADVTLHSENVETFPSASLRLPAGLVPVTTLGRAMIRSAGATVKIPQRLTFRFASIRIPTSRAIVTRLMTS